jgi:hypothetical protein
VPLPFYLTSCTPTKSNCTSSVNKSNRSNHNPLLLLMRNSYTQQYIFEAERFKRITRREANRLRTGILVSSALIVWMSIFLRSSYGLDDRDSICGGERKLYLYLMSKLALTSAQRFTYCARVDSFPRGKVEAGHLPPSSAGVKSM